MKFVNVTNHQLTQEQRHVVEAAGFEVIELPQELKKYWGAVDPEARTDQIKKELRPFINFIIDQRDRFGEVVVLVQGETTSTFLLVDMLLGMDDVIPVAATTKRQTAFKIDENGAVTKTSKFCHVRFRSYSLVGELRLAELGL